jgi:type IV pilus biogenesis protein CpaD/CtpE
MTEAYVRRGALLVLAAGALSGCARRITATTSGVTTVIKL